MRQHTIQVSENIYELLLKQAARLQTTPERVIEHLLVNDVGVPFEEMYEWLENATLSDETTGALAAVQRLTTLFANVNIPNLENILNDPMLAMANTDIGDLVR